jgi:RNA polymerase sigma-70 factor (ECF subfamily)
MNTTRASLLIRVRDPRDSDAWEEFHKLYAPLLYAYARARGLNHNDADEIRSVCYEAIVRQMPSFEYEKDRGGFKAWLRTLVQRRVVDWVRKRRENQAGSGELVAVEDSADGPDDAWERSWRQRHLAYCVEKVRTAVSEQTYSAFRLLLDDTPVPQICDQLGMNPNQVYKAKARVLELVKTEMQLLDPELSE